MMYERKIFSDADANDEKLKLELMKLDFFGKIITGHDLGLSKKWQDAEGSKTAAERTEADENKMVEKLEKLGFKTQWIN